MQKTGEMTIFPTGLLPGETTALRKKGNKANNKKT
jgi:hypothetical protein